MPRKVELESDQHWRSRPQSVLVWHGAPTTLATSAGAVALQTQALNASPSLEQTWVPSHWPAPMHSRGSPGLQAARPASGTPVLTPQSQAPNPAPLGRHACPPLQAPGPLHARVSPGMHRVADPFASPQAAKSRRRHPRDQPCEAVRDIAAKRSTNASSSPHRWDTGGQLALIVPLSLPPRDAHASSADEPYVGRPARRYVLPCSRAWATVEGGGHRTSAEAALASTEHHREREPFVLLHEVVLDERGRSSPCTHELHQTPNSHAEGASESLRSESFPAPRFVCAGTTCGRGSSASVGSAPSTAFRPCRKADRAR